MFYNPLPLLVVSKNLQRVEELLSVSDDCLRRLRESLNYSEMKK